LAPVHVSVLGGALKHAVTVPLVELLAPPQG
jgi:hypothetical protein